MTCLRMRSHVSCHCAQFGGLQAFSVVVTPVLTLVRYVQMHRQPDFGREPGFAVDPVAVHAIYGH